MTDARRLREHRRHQLEARKIRRLAGDGGLGGRSGLVAPRVPKRKAGGEGLGVAMPEPLTNGGQVIGSGQLLVMSATGVEIASGGDHVAFDAIVAQEGFAGVVVAGESWTHPFAGVYMLVYEHEWANFEGGGIVRVELDGVLAASGILMSGTDGRQGIGVVTYAAGAGQVGKVYVVQSSGVAQACNAQVQVAITDPTTVPAEATAADGGYRVSVSSDQDAIYLHRKVVGESEISLDSVPFSTSPDTWYGVRARIDGGRVRARAWVWGDDEPGTWMLDATDPEPLTAGYAGIATKGPFPNGQGGNQDVNSFACTIEGGPVQSTDFTGDAAGTAPPSGWGVLVEQGEADWTVTDVSGDIMLRYAGSSSSAGQWIGWQAAGAGLTMEVVAQVRHSDSSLSSGIVLRGVVE